MDLEQSLIEATCELNIIFGRFVAESKNVACQIKVNTYYWEKVDDLISVTNENISTLEEMETMLTKKCVGIPSSASTSGNQSYAISPNHSPRKRCMLNETNTSPTMKAISDLNMAVAVFKGHIANSLIWGNLKDDKSKETLDKLTLYIHLWLKDLLENRKRLEEVKNNQNKDIDDLVNSIHYSL